MTEAAQQANDPFDGAQGGARRAAREQRLGHELRPTSFEQRAANNMTATTSAKEGGGDTSSGEEIQGP